MRTDCNICNEICMGESPTHGSVYADMVKNGTNVIAKTENLLIIPSIGPLNASHVMIVPKEHVNSFESLPELKAEKIELIGQLRNYYFDAFEEKLIFFESGAGKLISHSGGCIIHAHIHAVTSQQGFDERLFSEVDLVSLKTASLEADLNYGYIWYSNVDSEEYLANNPMLPSQFMRYTYAQGSSNNLLWNWRRHGNISGVQQVIDNYKAFLSWQKK